MRKHYTQAQRAELIELVTSGQATPRMAAAQLGVTESTADYWLKCARQRQPALVPVARSTRPRPSDRARSSATPVFARLVRASEAPGAITLRVGGAIVEVRPGFEPVLLREVIAALMEAAS
jgi:transposase-like protein